MRKKVGFIKSVTYNHSKNQTQGIIETVNNEIYPFIISQTKPDIEKGKMVKFSTDQDDFIPSADNVEKL